MIVKAKTKFDKMGIKIANRLISYEVRYFENRLIVFAEIL
jgi:hypothetical protein